MFKAILAKPPNINKFKSDLLKDLKKAGEPPKKDFEKTTQTWDNKPAFKIDTKDYNTRIELFVGVESTWRKGQKAKPEDIYMFVTRGTSVRHALMSPDFSPKTRKRVIGSSSGRGGVIRVSKALRLEGIDGREFEQAVTDKNKDPLKKSVEKSFSNAAITVNWKL